MIRLSVPKSARSAESRTTTYYSFKGVDFCQDPSLVDAQRSPDAPNLVSDIGGMPEKRLGWRTILNFEGRINGLFYGEMGGEKIKLAHAGESLYSFTDTEKTLIYDGLADRRSCGFFMSGKFYILTGEGYYSYDGESLREVTENAYIPTILISRNPTGGGTVAEAVNLIGRSRRECFLGNATDTTYYLSAADIDEITKVEVMDANGEMTEYTLTTGNPGTNEYKADLAAGSVTFASAHAPVVTGVDNVYITYKKTIAEYENRIKGCTVFAFYGKNSENRVFLSGNPDYKAYDFMSGLYDPSYFPDTKYSVVGDTDTAIMGYRKLGKYLMIIKEPSLLNATVFQRWGETDSEGETWFYHEPGISGSGAVSKYCFSDLVDEPLFLSERGIMAISSNSITYERALRNRSYYVNPRLLSEEELSLACACTWQGYYLLAVNGAVYVLDSKNKSYIKNQSYSAGDFVYECFYWTNVPAKMFLSIGSELYFADGGENGRIMKFNTDNDLLSRFNDDNEAIYSAWATKIDNDSAPHLIKVMEKRGCFVSLKPYKRSGCKIYAVKDGGEKKLMAEGNIDMFSFFDADFNRFTFNGTAGNRRIFINRKIKKYRELQLIIENDSKNEGFGVYGITKTYYRSNFARK